jgi:predicted nucleic acid-binding protein
MSSGSQGNDFVADTMALVLRLEKRKMKKDAKAAFDLVEGGKGTIFLPTMVLAEVLYLSEKKRISLALQDIEKYISQFPSIKECPLTFAIVTKAAEINDVQELHDRLIGATARFLGLPLITNDPILEASTFVKTIW